MAKVSLRGYNHELEGLIEAGQLDEAVAHCQHILRTFPMHVETYRLLGKSYLEARRYTDAADIFERVLMAVPDDFVAHVGMSIIRDDEGKLDDAIWHMERAFESQPSNPAIQSELRRLYGRRDGVEPPKIRLSRDALANMYSQGELFNQAIAEIRAVLVEDANRPDLQVMLARAYYRAGQKVEAAEIASNLLKKYMYCMDALRILVDVLPGSASVENTHIYSQHLRMLDPYSSFVTGSVFNTAQVADTTVNLERLEYEQGPAQSTRQPNWAASLGIKLAEEKRVEPTPDWMAPGNSDVRVPGEILPSSGSAPTPRADDKPVPDWMRTAGWQESSAQTREGLADSAQQPAEPLARADIPDWLKSMAPQELAEGKTDSEPAAGNPLPSSAGDAPDWLAGLATASADANPAPSRPVASSPDNFAFPEWLKEIGGGISSGAAAAFTADGLEQLPAEEVSASTLSSPPPPVTQEPAQPPVTTLPPEKHIPFQPAGESKPLKIEDDAMAWLESLAAKQGAKEEELLTRPEDRSEEIPDWLRSTNEQPPASVTHGSSPAPRGTLPLEPPAPFAEGPTALEPGPSAEISTKPKAHSDSIPDWLRSADEKPASPGTLEPSRAPGENESLETQIPLAEGPTALEPGPSAEISTIPENRSIDLPDWLRSADEQPVSPGTQEPSPMPGGTIPLEPLIPITEGSAVLETAPSAESSIKPGDRPDALPDWLQSADERLASPASSEPSPAPGENVPLESSTPLAAELLARESASSEEPPIQPSPGVTAQSPDNGDDTKAWLESLATGQGVGPDELQTNPTEPSGIPSDWVQKPSEAPPAPEAVLPPETPNTLPEEDMSITSWLSKVDVEKALGEDHPVPQVSQSDANTSNELPDWLKNVENPLSPEGDLKPVEKIPDWLRQPAQPVDQGVTSVPGFDPIPEPEIPASMDETTPVSEPPAPTTPEEWVPMDETPSPVQDLEPVANPASIPVDTPFQRQIPRGTGMLSRVPSENKDAEYLTRAQVALDSNQLNDAMQAYTLLIKKKRLLDEVIHDLREAIYRYPVDSIVWQTLGDASMRANRLQDALDAYTKAEELLR